MVFDFIVDKKKQSDLQPIYSSKQKILYTQDQFLNIYLSKYNIDKYVLFIKRENEFSVAAWKGYISENIEYIKYQDKSLFVELLIKDKQIITADDIENFYSETIMLPREVYPIIKNEKEIWSGIRGTHCFPLEKRKDGLFGFFICRSSECIEKSKEVTDFMDTIYHWANEYHNMYLSNVAKMEIERYSKFVQYVDKISRVETDEALATESLFYYLDLFKSTKGIVYELKQGYFHAQKIHNLDFVQAYSRIEFQKYNNKDNIEIKEKTDIFFKEFGLGSLRIIFINSKFAIVIKKVFSISIDQSFLNTVNAITDRVHKCQTQKNSLK